MKIPLINKNNPLPAGYRPILDCINENYQMEKRAAYCMRMMLHEACCDGINLVVFSAYRSAEYQQKIFDEDVQKYVDRGICFEDACAKTALNIAVPRESEHNAGLAVDIKSDSWEGEITTEFEDTKEFEWLSKNAHRFGFILRYPKGEDCQKITGISYEPWHYRYVGQPHAKYITKKGITLEEYLDIAKQ